MKISYSLVFSLPLFTFVFQSLSPAATVVESEVTYLFDTPGFPVTPDASPHARDGTALDPVGMFLGISTPSISGAVYPENRSMVITGISAVDVPAESATPGGLDLSFGDFTIEMWVNRSNDSSGTLFQMHEVPNFATLNIALSVRGGTQ